MALRAGYSSVFSPVFDASGSFSGQINANIPGDLNVGTTGDTYKIFLNGAEFTGGGGGGTPSNWANYEATSEVNVNLKGITKLNSINYLPVYVYGNGSNIFAIGSNAALSNQGSVSTIYALGNYAGWSNSGNNVYAFGSNAGYLNSGSNLFAAGTNAGMSNGGSNVIAIGNDAGARDNLNPTASNVIAIGVSAGYNNKSRDVIAIGHGAGYNNSGNYSILLGTNPNTAFSNDGDYRFLVYSSNQSTPFMYGDMQNNRLCINGSSFVSNYNFTVAGSTYLDGITKISNTLTVDSGGLRVFNPATFSSTIQTTGIVTLQSNLNVSGAGAFTGAVSLQSNLNVTGAVSLQSNLNVSGSSAFTGAVSLQSNLNVSGLATISGAAIQSNASVGGTLTVPTVSSLTTLNGTINFLTPVGTITMYCAGTAPTGWLICDGTSFLRSAYPALSAVIGSNFGGNPTNFNVPDLRSRFPIGTSTIYPLATTSGSATYTLTSNNLPVHNHPVGASLGNTTHTHPVTGRTLTHTVRDPGHSHPLSGESDDYNAGEGVASGNQYQLFYNAIQSNTTGITVDSHVIPDTNTGNNSATPTVSVTVSNSTNANNAFSILNPCISVNYIIKF